MAPGAGGGRQLLSTYLPLNEWAAHCHLSPLWKTLRWSQVSFPWLNQAAFL